MAGRSYYSIRTGKHHLGSKLDLAILLKLFFAVYSDFGRKGYFQEAFGSLFVVAEVIEYVQKLT